ncbi:MAG: nicotinate-nucleotide--dimethylbenzimidazole phosphoribosyltransferase [Rubrivivax sp.]|nr:nicotinate-nucleotide--dimethylbenzimidazole phosphoribosyltransferase [Rubrivivax sp.]
MSAARSLVNPTSNPALERALRDKLVRRQEVEGGLGELEPLAIRIGLMQNTLRPRFREPQLMVFAADHGVAVDGVDTAAGVQARSTAQTVQRILTHQLPLTVFARAQQMRVTVVDCGLADNPPVHDRLLLRKIAHGTRNTRVTMAMSLEQAHAAMRAGMEIGDKLRGNATVLAGVGVGSHESAALVLARLSDSPIRDLVISGPDMDTGRLTHLMAVVMGAQARHRDISEPVEVLAAFGGFEVAVMVGVMLMAASKRHLLMIDGVPACAALMVASRIAPAVTDYCVFCRSHHHRGLDQALNLFSASALLELGMEATDGTGAVLAWPLVRSAAALLTEVADGEEAGPSMFDAFDDEPEPFAPESEAQADLSAIFGPKLY